MLGGSFWRSGNQLRISAQLIVATTDAHLWERASTTTPAITSRIANAPRRRADRRGSRPADQTSHGIRLYSPGARRKAQAEFADAYAAAISLLEHALTLDLQSVEAQTRLVGSRVGRVMNGLTDPAGDDLIRCGRAGWPSLGRIASLRLCAFGQRARYCVPRVDTRRPFSNTRRRAR